MKRNNLIFKIYAVFVAVGIGVYIYFLFARGYYILINLAAPLVALFTALGALISYFIKNESEKEDRENTRKIQVHSEAQWRKRLFDLVEKEELTKNDVIYFLSFFNSNNPTSNIDKLMFKICYALLEDDKDSDSITNYFDEIKKLFNSEDYSTISIKNIKNINLSDRLDKNDELKNWVEKEEKEEKELKKILNSVITDMTSEIYKEYKDKTNNEQDNNEKVSILKEIVKRRLGLVVDNCSLTLKQQLLFRAAINTLLKDDWNTQTKKD